MNDAELVKAFAATLRAYKNAAEREIPVATVHKENAAALLHHVDTRAEASDDDAH